jgi:hypothetical protein
MSVKLIPVCKSYSGQVIAPSCEAAEIEHKNFDRYSQPHLVHALSFRSAEAEYMIEDTQWPCQRLVFMKTRHPAVLMSHEQG